MSRFLAASEMVKNSIISEIEENLSTQRQSIMQVLSVYDISSAPLQLLFFLRNSWYLYLQDDLLGLCSDRDCLVTPFALQKAIRHGIDPRYTTARQVRFIVERDLDLRLIHTWLNSYMIPRYHDTV